MGIVQINQLPDGSGLLSNDDIMLFMNSPSSSPSTRKITWANVIEQLSSPANLQLRRGTASEVSGIIPLQGEPVWDTTNNILYIGDGVTYGGVKVAYPVISTVATNYTISTDGSPLSPITLSPINSIWHIEATYRIQDDWNSHGNTIIVFQTTSFSGINRPDGSSAGTVYGTFTVTNDEGTTTIIPILNNNIELGVEQTMGYYVKISCFAKVTSATGIIDFAVTTDNESSIGAVKFYTCNARRII